METVWLQTLHAKILKRLEVLCKVLTLVQETQHFRLLLFLKIGTNLILELTQLGCLGKYKTNLLGTTIGDLVIDGYMDFYCRLPLNSLTAPHAFKIVNKLTHEPDTSGDSILSLIYTGGVKEVWMDLLDDTLKALLNYVE